ncbi:MAG: hypothetical protein FWD13_08290 [Treponema sp.]|nr:hypothetical protein [Treponema sp.]
MCEIYEMLSIVELISKIILLLLTISGILFGIRKTTTIIKSYNDKYLQAVFGYYINLQTYCMLLKEKLEILTNSDRSNYFNNDEELTMPTKKYCKNIRDTIVKLLDFFSLEKGQIPPNKIWNENLKKLREKICICMYIGNVDPPNKEIFLIELNSNLTYFLEEIPKIQNNFIEKCVKNR